MGAGQVERGPRKSIMTFLDSTTPLHLYLVTVSTQVHRIFLPMFPPHAHALNPACPLILFPIVRLMWPTRTRTRRTKRFLVRGQGSNFAMLRNKEATGGDTWFRSNCTGDSPPTHSPSSFIQQRPLSALARTTRYHPQPSDLPPFIFQLFEF